MDILEDELIAASSSLAYNAMPRLDAEQADRLERDLAVLNEALAPSDPRTWAGVLYRLTHLPSRALVSFSDDDADQEEEIRLMIADMAQALSATIPQDLAELTRFRAMRALRFFPTVPELVDQVKDEISERKLQRATVRLLLQRSGRTAQ